MLKDKKTKKTERYSLNENSMYCVEKNIIDNLLNYQIPNKKAKIKLTDKEFSVPNLTEYNNILEINYNLHQLKNICKHYNLKLAGNKDILKKRCYNFSYFSNFAIIIQKFIRKFFVKKYILLHGPGLYNRSKCVNDTDFGTLDYIIDIPFAQFFSFKDNTEFIYAFDIQSIYNLYIKNKNNSQIENPYTKQNISKTVLTDVIKFIKYSNLLKININITYEKLTDLSESKQLELKILNLFQTMDSLGNYTNMSWFNSLNKHDLIKFLRELFDIWNYRANLTQEIKREICPPFGNPFRNIHINYIHNYNCYNVKKLVINIMDQFINKGINTDSKALGSIYILSALTLVSSSAAEAMPWLYESVIYNSNN